MAEQEVVLSDQSVTDQLDLTSTLANTRILNEEQSFTVQEATISTRYDIQSFHFRQENDDPKYIVETPEDEPDRFPDSNEVRVGRLTENHINNYADSDVLRNLVPLEPFVYDPPNYGKQTIYFGNCSKKYVVSLLLSNVSNEQQTVYKTFRKKAEAEAFVQKMEGDNVRLFHSEDESTIKIESLIHNSKTNKNEDRNNTEIFVPVAVGISWLISVGLSFSDPIWNDVSLVLLVGTMLSSCWAVMQMNSKDRTHTRPPQLERSAVTLAEPRKGDSKTSDFVTTTPVSTEFDENGLTLNIGDSENPISMEYETDGGVFKDTSIVEFYTDLGFDQSEKTEFTAFISTEELDVDMNYICDKKRDLYLYPENPL